MEQLIAMCGVNCMDCIAYKATFADDDRARAKVAIEWSKMYNCTLEAKDINCDGCMSGSETLFSHCTRCEIRSCGIERGLKNCGFCEDYVCERLTNFLKGNPEAKATLDKIHSAN